MIGTAPLHRRDSDSGSRRRLAAVCLAVAALAIGLTALEALTRVVFNRNGMHFGIEMWKYAREIKQRSPVAAMGHEHAPNRDAILMGVPVRINADGLRDREFQRARTPGVRRIMVLGDSMTFGWGARQEDTYSKVLERRLNQAGRPTEVINTGVGNYNTTQEVAYFRERGRAYRPDDVILAFYINDAEPTPQPVQNPLARHSAFYVLASSGFDAVQRRVGLKQDLLTYYSELYSDRNPGWEACRAAIAEFRQLAGSIGAAPLVAIIPELHHADADYPFRHVHELVADLARRASLPVLDLTPAFTGVEPLSLWVSRGDAHPNARAHQLIATALYDALVDKSPRRPDAGDNNGEQDHE